MSARNPNIQDAKLHDNSEGCACCHGHEHSHHKKVYSLTTFGRWFFTLIIVMSFLFLLRPFVISQMFVRVTSYAANGFNKEALRICKNIIFLDPHNLQAWTSLGYIYQDLSKLDEAETAFKEVLRMDPQNKAAASFELAKIYFAKGQWVEVIRFAESVRNQGPRAEAILEADILKYRHGMKGFRSLNSMQVLLDLLVKAYTLTGNTVMAKSTQELYNAYINRHRHVKF